MHIRYERAVARNLDELQRAILIRTSLKGIETAGEIQFLFLKLAYNSLLNDYMAKCIKVFERSKQAASFWYIQRANEKLFSDYAKTENVDINQIEATSNRLKHLRDKAHFHIDFDGVMDQQAVWVEAGISEQELHSAVNGAHRILIKLRDHFNLQVIEYPNYSTIIPYRIAKVINSGRW